MDNLVQRGETMPWTNGTGSDVSSGDAVVVGGQIGVAITDIADGSSGDLAMAGVFSLPKTAGAAINQGDAAMYDVSASAFVPSGGTPATGDVTGAVACWEDAASAATTVKVKINVGVGTVN